MQKKNSSVNGQGISFPYSYTGLDSLDRAGVEDAAEHHGWKFVAEAVENRLSVLSANKARTNGLKALTGNENALVMAEIHSNPDYDDFKAALTRLQADAADAASENRWSDLATATKGVETHIRLAKQRMETDGRWKEMVREFLAEVNKVG